MAFYVSDLDGNADELQILELATKAKRILTSYRYPYGSPGIAAPFGLQMANRSRMPRKTTTKKVFSFVSG